MKKICQSIPALLAGMICNTAWADFDVRPTQLNQTGKIETRGFSDDANAEIPDQQAFGFGFEDPDAPFSINDPGFNAPTGYLTPGAQLFLSIQSNLLYWNGTGLPSFGAPAGGESLQLTKTFGASSVAYTASISGAAHSVLTYLPATPAITTPVAALKIGTTTSSGAGGFIHEHLSSDLLGSDANALPALAGSWGPGDGIQAADGIYAFQAQLFLSTSANPGNEIAATRSDPFWIVYNSGLPDVTLDNAVEALATPVPEPGSLAIGIAGAAGLLFTLRRQRGATAGEPFPRHYPFTYRQSPR